MRERKRTLYNNFLFDGVALTSGRMPFEKDAEEEDEGEEDDFFFIGGVVEEEEEEEDTAQSFLLLWRRC